VTHSFTTRWGKKTLTLSVYILLPWSSTVYIRCILVDEEPAERYGRMRNWCRGPFRTGRGSVMLSMLTRSSPGQKLFVKPISQHNNNAVRP
jgi:hypothetical protein